METLNPQNEIMCCLNCGRDAIRKSGYCNRCIGHRMGSVIGPSDHKGRPTSRTPRVGPIQRPIRPQSTLSEPRHATLAHDLVRSDHGPTASSHGPANRPQWQMAFLDPQGGLVV